MYVLLGNGVNLNGTNRCDYTNEAIALRFADNLFRHQRIFEGLFYTQLGNEIAELTKLSENENIEHIVERLYDVVRVQYLESTKRETLPVAVHHRILDTIATIGISSIFFKDNKMNYPDVPTKIVSRLINADKIFTLNYFECWDQKSNCIYLHGKYQPRIINPGGTILCDMLRLKYYRDLISPCEILAEIDNSHNLVMAPISINKHKMKVIYPGSNTLPSDDLFLGATLYKEIEEHSTIINEAHEKLHVFGMSPYGDKGIISCLSSINGIVIYIYDRVNNSQQEDVWRALFPNADYKDSTEFYI